MEELTALITIISILEEHNCYGMDEAQRNKIFAVMFSYLLQ